MFELAFKLLLSRKKWLFLMIITLAIIISSTLSIFTASEAIRDGLLNKGYSQYGKHSGGLVEVKASKEELKGKVQMIGSYNLVDSYPLNNKGKLATIGWMDKDAINLANLSLLEGRFPKGKGEVAIESAYLNLIHSNWAIGDTITLQGKNKKWTVKLVGVISNYSSKWYVPIHLDQGVNAFPNIFISNTESEISLNHNFLINMGNDKKKSMAKMEELLAEYKNNGFVNNKLFLDGLRDYDTIRYLSISFQVILLLISIFSLVSMFTYYNKLQLQKMGILRAIGFKVNNLFLIYIYEVTILFFTSLAISFPILPLFKSLIIKMTYTGSSTAPFTSFFTYAFIITFLLLLFLLVLSIFCYSLFRAKHNSVKTLMSGITRSPVNHAFLKSKIRLFAIKQLARQLFLYPKEFIFTVCVLTFSILTLLFSIVLQKESDGIWDAEEYYYLSAQEIYGFDTVDNLPVLLKQGLTFSDEDAKKIAQISGVKHLEKNPFMVDVVPLIKSNQMTPSIINWIQKYGVDIKYGDKQIVPNVRYEVVDKQAFEMIYPKGDYEKFKGKVMLFIPNTDGNQDNLKMLKGEKISFVKLKKEKGSIQENEKQFVVYDVINQPLVKKISGLKNIEYDNFTILIDKESFEEYKFFNGYFEFKIYLDKNLTNNDFKKIDSHINQLIATVPGSFFQNIPEFIQKDTQITSLLSFLGKFAFIIASVLSILSMTIVVFSKYQLQKKEWGIYLSMGMSKKTIYYFLTLEMLIYLLLSIILSFVIYISILYSANLVYPVSSYFIYFFNSIMFVLLLIVIGSSIMYGKIVKKSISSMLREVE
ncbi:ABC transporter permease [Bacillus sp. SJS]|uniref:ABC transporter permease n=1 Tax=Bacillus sp. SJS TaxID=1423321 RepID=UPI0004DCDF0C|nr:ABC transporter permease [Bacillus sp. SJS]KZZ82675.1 hypothetical protein AS29_017850 [Bacillus sp. SJS]